MSDRRGSALVWLMFVVLLLMMIGASLMKFAQSDLRVSGHHLAASQAQYAAEAGIEMAVAVLGPLCRDLNEDGWSFTHAEEPMFTVQAETVTASVLRIRSVGSAGGLTETVEVLAALRPLGRQAVVAKRAVLGLVQLNAHLVADEIVFTLGENRIAGDVRRRWLETIAGGTYYSGGHLCANAQPYNVSVDFVLLRKTALAGWWELVDGTYRLERMVAGPLFVSGNVEVALQEKTAGYIAATGDVTITSWMAGSKLVIIAGGDVTLPIESEVWDGSLFLYSAGKITRSGDGVLTLAGAMVAEKIDIVNLALTYCDEAFLLYLKEMPPELLRLGATFDLEWLDLEPRR